MEEQKTGESKKYAELAERFNQIEKENADLRAYRKANEADQEEDESIQQDYIEETRGGAGKYLPPVKTQNFLLCFGC